VRERSYAMPEMVRSISRERVSKGRGTISAAKLNEISHRVHLLTRATRTAGHLGIPAASEPGLVGRGVMMLATVFPMKQRSNDRACK
jgi:hypothetical protein